jgi:hypothetical protein
MMNLRLAGDPGVWLVPHDSALRRPSTSRGQHEKVQT